MPTHPGNRRRLTRAIRATVALLTVAAAGTVSATPASATYPGEQNGRLAFGMLVDGNVDIYTATPTGHGLKRLTTGPAFDACAAYSADGRNIAYCSGAAGVLEIWTMRANGTGQRPVTRLGGFAGFPDFSPDGTRIAFTAHGVNGNPQDEIYLVDTDGTHLRQLTAGAGRNLFPAWSPDGTRIAFISDRTGIQQVYVMNADGTQQTQLTVDPNWHDQLPDWSPDGARIAHEDDGYGNGDIMLMNADGTNPIDLTNTPAQEVGPAWSPDGTQIAYLHVDDPNHRLVYLMNADGTGQHSVTPGQGPPIRPRLATPRRPAVTCHRINITGDTPPGLQRFLELRDRPSWADATEAPIRRLRASASRESRQASRRASTADGSIPHQAAPVDSYEGSAR